MALSPDQRQLALSVMAEGSPTGLLPSALIVIDISSGAHRVVIPSSSSRPAVSCWLDNHTVLYTVRGSNQLGVNLREVNVGSLIETSLRSPGFTVYDATCQGHSILFDGLDPSGDQGIFLFDATNTSRSPRALRLGSYSYVSAEPGVYCAVWSGTGPENGGDVVVDAWSP